MSDWDTDENGVIQSGPFKGSHTKPNTVHPSRRRELVWHRPVPPTVQRVKSHKGVGETAVEESHPAWGLISVHRTTVTPGAVLFDSDIRHTHVIRVTLKRASRQRDLNRDWIHETGRDLIEVDMSEAQWGAFVSSFNTSGVPCTIRSTETCVNVDGLEFEPRLKESMEEIKGAANKVFGRIQDAMAEWDALPKDAGVKARREVMEKIRRAADSAANNMTFAAQSLEEHAENVVQKARADIEAMVYTHAERLGLDPKQTLNDLVLESAVMAEQQAAIESGLEVCDRCGYDTDPCLCEPGGLD